MVPENGDSGTSSVTWWRDASAVAHWIARSSSPRRGGNGWRPATTRIRMREAAYCNE